MNFWIKFKSGCAQLSLTCRDASRALSEQLDHPLPQSRRIGLWLHLLICDWCRRYERQLRFLRHAACDHQEKFIEASPHKLSPEARERIKRRLQHHE